MVSKPMKQKQRSKKNVKKSFYDVEAPITATKISLYGAGVEEFDGRTVNIDLTRSLRGKALELSLKIKNEEGKLKAYPVKARLSQGYIRRIVRRGTDYVEDSFVMNCRDKSVRVKPFLIARRRVSRAVRNALRRGARKFLEGYIKGRTSDEVFTDLLANKIQKGLAIKLKKIYPLGMSELRVFEVLGERNEDLEEIKEEKLDEVVEDVNQEKESKKEVKKKTVKKVKKSEEKEK